jgi:hypothetical protein
VSREFVSPANAEPGLSLQSNSLGRLTGAPGKVDLEDALAGAIVVTIGGISSVCGFRRYKL